MNRKIKFFDNRGVSLVEIIIAATIITVFIGALIGSYSLYLRISLASVDKVKTTFLAEEGMEVVRFLARSDWEAIEVLDVQTDYYLSFDTLDSSWSISQTETPVDGIFDRRIVFEDVFRDSNDQISDSGTFDPDAKKVTVSVSFPSGGFQTNHSITSFVINI